VSLENWDNLILSPIPSNRLILQRKMQKKPNKKNQKKTTTKKTLKITQTRTNLVPNFCHLKKIKIMKGRNISPSG